MTFDFLDVKVNMGLDNATDAKGRTPLRLAIFRNNTEVAELLRQLGASK